MPALFLWAGISPIIDKYSRIGIDERMVGVRSNTVLGLVLIVVGIVLFTNNYGITSIEIWKLWPIVLILWGLSNLHSGKSSNDMVIGGGLIVLGILFLGQNFGYVLVPWDMFWKLFWPTLIILLGIGLIRG